MVDSTERPCEENSDVEQNLQQSLTGAIFTPFKGFNVDARKNISNRGRVSPTSPALSEASMVLPDVPLDPETKLEKILKLLPIQQDLVRGQMITIILQQLEMLKARARKEIERIEKRRREDFQFRKEEKRREEQERLEMEEMFRRIKYPARPENVYELEAGGKFIENFWRLPQKPSPHLDSDGDVEMSDGEGTARNVREVRDKLARDMQLLLKCAQKNLDEYDVHCRAVMQPYESSMARRKPGTHDNYTPTSPHNTTSPSFNPSGAQSANGTGGIIRSETSHDVVRLSNGMPVSMERLPMRKIESLGELTRRKK